MTDWHAQQDYSSKDSHLSLVSRLKGGGYLSSSISVALLAILFGRIDVAQLWQTARLASVVWLGVALGIYGVNVLANASRPDEEMEMVDLLLRLGVHNAEASAFMQVSGL